MRRDQQIGVATVLRALRPDESWEFHHGDCVGADAEAHDLAIALAATIVIHPPTNSLSRAHCKGDDSRAPKPYLDRNRDIVDETDVLVAAPADMTEQPKGGTWYTIRYARKQGRVINIVWPDGKLTVEHNEGRDEGRNEGVTK